MHLFNRFFLIVLLASISCSAGIAREKHEGDRREGGTEGPGLVVNKAYAKECGACHLAYPPQLLPKRSWIKIMSTLDNHFGENASLGEAVRTQILSYVVGNSAEVGRSEASRKILSSISDADTPLRISDTSYFKRKHRKIQPDVFKRKSILSPANCAGCHPAAEKGDFEDDRVKIPNN